MAQLTCANLTVEGTIAVWVGLTGTWKAGDWSAWKWEVASSTSTTRLPWSSKYKLPFQNSSYTYGFFDPNKGLVNWINNFQARYLCQRYLPKDNWYVCSMSKSLGLMEILYISTPKTFDEATTECAGRGSILANLQSINHRECARSVLGPRNGQCNSSSGDNCRNASSGCETNTCNVWVALQRPSKNLTWVLPVPSASSTIPWINSTTRGSGERKCGYYSPEKEGFGIESCTMKLSFYCQRYTPNAPSNIAGDSTETEIFARLLQPQILWEWISGFCFVYAENGTATYTTSVCGTGEAIVLTNLRANTSYRVRAFYTTTTGMNSSISQEVYIGTLPKVRWNACAQTNTSTWQVDWTFRFDHKTWKDANISCRSLGGSLATVQTIAQLQCANSTVMGTSGTWVGLTGTWSPGNWSAWKWEAALSSVTAQLPWSLQFPFIRPDYIYGYYQPDKIRLRNWDKQQSLRYLCQRYVPKDNWYECSLDQEASGRLETLYIPSPKTYDDASAECARRRSILANIQNRYHGECAGDLLGPRNGQCNSSSSDNCKTSSYFCKTNTCNVWVALQRPSQSNTWTWMLPVPISANNVSWITAPLQGGGGRNECGFYFPEKESFGIESCSMKLSYYCQRYTPKVPSALAANSTDTQIYARIVQPEILRDWVSDFCFLYAKNGTSATPTVVCDKNESTVLSGLATNTLYRIRAFFKTTIGHNSSMSSEIIIGTLPKAPNPPLNPVISSTTITVFLGRIEEGNLPIRQYCVHGMPANDLSGNMPLVPVCSASKNVTLPGLKPNMSYNVTAFVSNAYGDSDQSSSTRITTLPTVPSSTIPPISGNEASTSGISVGGFVGLAVAGILTVILAVAMAANRKRISRWFSSKDFTVPEERPQEDDPIELNQYEDVQRNDEGEAHRPQDHDEQDYSYSAVGARIRDEKPAEADTDVTVAEHSHDNETEATAASGASALEYTYATPVSRKRDVKHAELDTDAQGAEHSDNFEEPATELAQSKIGCENVLGEFLSPTDDETIEIKYAVLDRTEMKPTSQLTRSQDPKVEEEREHTSYATICNPIYDVAGDPPSNTADGFKAEHIYDAAVNDGPVHDRKQG
ncbi:uncharacterized protein LOC135826543 [Sycon ciliatum]|uniref:uncharacterized protein LOC135826543 n=1 Tax=Sycon ciliatum TaxID=27933 RepID=UPI0031F68F24